MELHQLRIFVSVAAAKNLTRGAQRLYLTPSTASAHIKALEDELGVVLFVRTTKGMELTEQGARLKANAEAVLSATRTLLQQATALQAQLAGRLRCGLNASPSFLRVAPLAQYMRQAHPQIVLDWVASASGAIIEALHQGSLDAGYIFGSPPSPPLITHCLGLVEVVIAAPRQWATQMAAADWAVLAQLPWISSDGYCPFQTLTDALFQQRGLQYHRIAQTNDDGTKVELVAAGVGVAMLERHEAAQAQLVIWDTAPMYCALHFAYSTGRHDDPLVQAFHTAVRQVWGEPQGSAHIPAASHGHGTGGG